jgi:hypothetical protein
MIRVLKAANQIPADWLTKANNERDAAIAAFKKPNSKAARDFAFKAYGDPLLRKALNAIYLYKCAYCESFYGATQPVAVEHYRPKGEVIEGKIVDGDIVKDDVPARPGYYWLAADWTNLLPSCTDCNSRRTQFELDGTEAVRGKGNFFPLKDPKKRATAPAEIQRESPLLLNPATDDPEKHIEFLADPPEKAGLIRPALTNGKPSILGEASIAVYALDRPQLQQHRIDAAKLVLFTIKQTERALRRHQGSPADKDLKEEYEDCLSELREVLSPSRPYTGMTRQIVRARYPGLQI